MKKGFSLVEVMMTLAITGTILILTLPTFNTVRNKHLTTKYQSAVQSTHAAAQQILHLYYKTPSVNEDSNFSNLNLSNLQDFDLQDVEDWDTPEFIQIDKTEQFRIAPFQKDKNNFCTQIGSAFNLLTLPENAPEDPKIQCDASFNAPDDLNFITSSGIAFYGVNQDFPVTTDDDERFIDITVVLKKAKEPDDAIDDLEEYKIRVYSNGEVEPLGVDEDNTKAKEAVLVSYKFANVDPRDEDAIAAKLSETRGITKEEALKIIQLHKNVSTLITFKDFEIEKSIFAGEASYPNNIVYSYYFYKPKMADFAF